MTARPLTSTAAVTPTRSDRTFPALNALRAIGAFAVVATHTAFATGEINAGAHGAVLSRLDFGVAVFFVLSGFLLSRPYFRRHSEGARPHSYGHYLWKRALRILPLYWVTVVAALLLVPDNRAVHSGTWLRDLSLTQLYRSGLLDYGLTQMWSLCTEVVFYLLLPLLCWILLRPSRQGRWSPRRVFAGLLVLTVSGLVWQTVAATASDTTREHFHQWLPGFLPWFCVGIFFAFVSVHAPTRPEAPRWHVLDRWGRDLPGCWLVAAGVFALACTPIAGPSVLVPPDHWEAFSKSFLYAVSAGFLVLPFVFGPERDGFWRRTFSSPVAVWLGEVSYAVFCLHLIVLSTVTRLLHLEPFRGDFVDVFLLTVVGTLVLASLSLYVLERPLLRLKNSGPFAPSSVKARARHART